MSFTLEQQLTREFRNCPLCRMEITNPFVARCPRCFATVPMEETGCGSCVHRMSCPVIPSPALEKHKTDKFSSHHY